ncbi:ankyrin repeat-containing domain protein [Jackrogersella minutella]|nr:ankyrin repeat-containing domain protein [Jackrogersella minutella]
MHRAVKEENTEALQYMLANEQQVEPRDMSNSTLLHTAAEKRNQYLCALLLKEHHADPNVVDYHDMTPLHRCQSDSGGVVVAEMLLEHCPDLVNRVDGHGKTALYLACEKGNQKMVKALLTKGRATPDIPGPGNCTPLIAAIDLAAQSSRKIPIVELLLKYGANPNIPDVDGRTAFAAAKNAGLAGSEIKRMLSLIPPRASAATVNSTRRSNSERSLDSNGIRSLALSTHQS